MKALNLIAWISAGFGVLLLILAAISLFVGSVFGEHVINFFHAANSFFLITIALFIFLQRNESKK